MYGAILGDLAGSRYEHEKNRDPDVPIWTGRDFLTDDSFLTCAVADALLGGMDFEAKLREYYWAYPDGGYGGNFHQWARQTGRAYPSKGNGAPMRVSPVAYVARSEAEVKRLAKLATAPSHDTPDGIAAAQCVALMVYRALHSGSKDDVLAIAGKRIAFPEQTVAELREEADFRILAVPAVMAAVACVRESTSFEQAVRNAISIAADADTIGAIAGSIAGPLFGIPAHLIEFGRSKLDERLRGVCDRFTSGTVRD